ncbi:hypothetical protein [Celerinatantimonas sp. YJH-8]|uniref:hypothetical protein n=1 Tax=Celerinatantimonas sp. YJH-8 TaxID=3228714 RepID=UPI0038C15FDB
MRAGDLYDACLCACLLAGWDAPHSQQFAYQMSYLAEQASGLPPLFPDEATPRPSSQYERQKRRPVNPLSHIDWQGGGQLNRRWYQQFFKCDPSFSMPSDSVSVDWSMIYQAQLNQLIHQQIQYYHRGKPDVYLLLCAIFAKLMALNQPVFETLNDASGQLLFQVFHCLHRGDPFYWNEHTCSPISIRQQSYPQARIYSALIKLMAQRQSEPSRRQLLLQFIEHCSRTVQVQLMWLGVRYRRDWLQEPDDLRWQSFPARLRNAWLQLQQYLTHLG